ncbi:MAG: hypothetical protein JNK78_02540 [Planctomycetes bacterium]|nr:hypothetical protein [Planctomycetota bacterium]
MDLEVVLKGVLPSIGAALLLVSLGGARWLPLAVALGLLAASGLLRRQWPEWPHELWTNPNGTAWLPWVVGAGALVAFAEHFKILPRKAGLVLGAVVGAAAVWLVLLKVSARWTPTEVMLRTGGSALAAVLLVAGSRTVLQRAPANPFPAILFTLVLSVDAALITLGGTALIGQLCGAIAAAVGAGIGTALWRRPFAMSAADGTWLGVAHTAFLAAGAFLADLPLAAAGCAAVAPLALLLLREGVGSTKPKTWAFAATALAAVPLAGAVWFALPEASSG